MPADDVSGLRRSAELDRVQVRIAEGEAEAAKIISAAVHDAGSGIIEVRRIDTAKDIAALLDGKLDTRQ